MPRHRSCLLPLLQPLPVREKAKQDRYSHVPGHGSCLLPLLQPLPVREQASKGGRTATAMCRGMGPAYYHCYSPYLPRTAASSDLLLSSLQPLPILIFIG